MSNYKYAIKKLPIKSWIKYWLWRNRTGGTKYKFALSDVKEDSNFYLENTIKRKFNTFELFGKTTQDGTPTPENPIPIINLTGNINEKVQNKNLIKLTQPGLIMGTNNTISSSQYSKTIVDTRNINSLIVTGDFSLIGDNVIRAGGCNECPAIGVTGTRFTNISASNNVIDTTNYNYVLLTYVVEGGQTEAKDRAIENSFQIEVGTVASSYVPHAEQNISFPLAEGQYLAQGDYPADDGVHHVRAKIIYDGSEDENWNKGSSSPSGSVAFYLSKPSDLSSTATLSDLLCSYFINQEVVNGMRLASYLTFYPTTDINVTTTAEWRTWLSTHNIELEYPLAEEVIEPFTEEQQTAYNQIKELYTYNEITNIDGDANLKIKYWERVER